MIRPTSNIEKGKRVKEPKTGKGRSKRSSSSRKNVVPIGDHAGQEKKK